MAPNDHHGMEDRLSFRVPEYLVDWVAGRSANSTWANDSQVARDMVEMGLLVSHLASIDLADRAKTGEDPYFDPPVYNWERPQGKYPDDDQLVCPECANSSKILFRYRNVLDVEAIECLYCGHMEEADTFLHNLSESHYWGRGVPRGPWCIMDRDSRRSVCDRLSEPVETGWAPESDERPTNICRACWRELLGKDY